MAESLPKVDYRAWREELAKEKRRIYALSMLAQRRLISPRDFWRLLEELTDWSVRP